MIETITAELPPVLIQKDVAAFFGVTIQTLRNWRLAGFGPQPLRVGGALLYDRAAVEAFAKGAR